MDRRQALRHVPALLFGAYVLVASVVDPPSGAGGGLPAAPLGVGLDKWLHLAAYAALAFLLAFARDVRLTRATVAVAVVAAAYGAGIEVLQAFVPARAFDPADAATNALGALLGVSAWRGATAMYGRWRSARAPGER
jgi:VanZ family protein